MVISGDRFQRGVPGGATGGIGAGCVGGEPFQVADCHGRTARLVVDAFRLALAFLRAYTATDSGQCGGLFQHGCCFDELSALDVLDESGNVYADRTPGDALRVGAVETSGGLCDRLLGGETLVDLVVAGHAVSGIELRHLHTRNRHALLGGVGLAQLLAPAGVAR